MKRAIALILLLLPVLTYGQEVVFNTYTHNFGTIAEVDGTVSHTFTYTNNGSTPFVITSVATSCGCTTPTYSTKPLAAHASATITVRFDPSNRPGRFDKNITINSNIGTVRLTISGIVTPRPRTIKDDFPFLIGANLRASELLPRIEPAPRTRAISKTISIVNDSQIPITVTINNAALPDWISTKIEANFLQPNQKTTVTLTTKPTTMWGQMSTQIPIIVNGKIEAEKITLTTTFTRDLTTVNRNTAPKAEFSSYFHHFSTQKLGAKPSFVVKIRNTGTTPLIIDHIQNSSTNISSSIPRTTIAPMATTNLTITIAITSNDYISEFVRVITNDPSSPIREIRLTANGF